MPTLVRAAVLALCAALTLVPHDRWHVAVWWLLLTVVALLSNSLATRPTLAVVATTVEAVLVVVAVLRTGSATSPLLPALLGPAYAAGAATGLPLAAAPAVATGLALAAGGMVEIRSGTYGAAAATWLALSLAATAAASLTRRLQRTPTSGDESYVAAYRLLAQLRPVARKLPAGLEPVTIAEGLLASLRDELPFDRGAVFVRTGSTRLIPLAVLGAARVDWTVSVADDTVFADAWFNQRPILLAHQLSGPPGSAVVLPLVLGTRSFGLVGLESSKPETFDTRPATVDRLVADTAMRLETALLFDDVRGVATAEERQRLAREIHDGIAQELTYLGYVVDSLVAGAESGDGMERRQQLVELRNELTRMVRELRMSIYDLRSDVETHGGLGAALSEYVRTVGRQAGLTVHLSLTEGADRLPSSVEAELLRIAQEAVTNARKHAGADNLWVTLEVDPPAAELCVEDDGRGLGRPRADSFGLSIMRERAERLGATLTIHGRQPAGTTVEVRLLAAADRTVRVRPSGQERPDEELSR